MRSRSLTTCCAAAIMVFASLGEGVVHAYQLATAAEDGEYHKVGQEICRLVEKHAEGELSLTAKSTPGSIHNIEGLIKGDYAVAIVQNDVMRRLQQEPDELTSEAEQEQRESMRSALPNLRTLISLFPEYVQIIVRRDSDIRRLVDLDGRRLFLGPEGSGSRANAHDLLNYLNIDETRDVFSLVTRDQLGSETNSSLPAACADEQIDYPCAYALLADGQLDIVFTTSGTFPVNPNFRWLGLEAADVSDLRREHDYYGSGRKNPYPPGTSGTSAVRMLYTRANIVATEDKLKPEAARELVRIIYENQMELQKKVNRLNFFRGDHMVRRVTSDLHQGAYEYYRDNRLIPHAALHDIALLTLVGLISLTLLGNAFRTSAPIQSLLQSRLITTRFAPGSRVRATWDGYVKAIASSPARVVLWVVPMVFLVAVYFIQWVEKWHSINNDTENPFSGSNSVDTAFWLLTFAVTGFNQDIYPNTLLARMLAISVPVVGVLLAVYLLVNQTFRAEQESEKRARGLTVRHLRGHVLVCGLNSRLEGVLREITSSGSPLPAGAKVLVIGKSTREKPLLELGVDHRRVDFLRGLSSDYDTLRRANVGDAIGAIVLADDEKIQFDNRRSILTCMALHNSRLGAGAATDASFPIVAELMFPENQQYFQDCHASKLVCLRTVGARMVTHAVLNPGVSELLTGLLGFSGQHTVRRIPVSTADRRFRFAPELAGKAFGAGMIELRKHGVLLLAVREGAVEGAPANGALEVDFCKGSPYHFGPEFDYEIQPTDELIVATHRRGRQAAAEPLLRHATSTRFDYANSGVLILGNGWIEGEVARVLARSARQVTVLQVDDSLSKPHEERDGNLLRLSIPGPVSHELLDALYDRFLSDIDRALILAGKHADEAAGRTLYADDQTILHSKTLRRVFNQHGRRLVDFHIAAEIRDKRNLQLFRDAQIDQTIPATQFSELCLVHMVFHRGVVSEFFLKAMSYDDSRGKGVLRRLSVASLTELAGFSCVGLTYDELMAKYAQTRVQLVGIQATHQDNPATVVNPTDPHWSSYQLQKNDYVFGFLSPSAYKDYFGSGAS